MGKKDVGNIGLPGHGKMVVGNKLMISKRQESVSIVQIIPVAVKLLLKIYCVKK